MNSRPWPSQASPTGRKQPSGHWELSALLMTSVVALVLSEGSTGCPPSGSKRTAESL